MTAPVRPVEPHPAEDEEEFWPIPVDADETVSMDSFSSGELSADSLEYSTSTEANVTYLMRKGLMYKVVKKKGTAKTKAQIKRKKKAVKPVPVPPMTDPQVKVTNHTPHQGHLRVTKGDKDYDIFVEGGLPKAVPGVDAPTQLEKKIAGNQGSGGGLWYPRDWLRSSSHISSAERHTPRPVHILVGDVRG